MYSHNLIPQDIWIAYREYGLNSDLELGKMIPLWSAFWKILPNSAVEKGAILAMQMFCCSDAKCPLGS